MVRQESFELTTRGRGFTEVTARVCGIVSDSGIAAGSCQVFLMHTSASIILCENADPDVLRDLEAWAQRIARDGDPLFVHDAEGPDDMPAHIRSILAGVSVSFPVAEGRAALGTWQGIYLWEHRLQPQLRRLAVTVIGE